MPRSKQLSERMRADGQARILAAARQLFAHVGYDRCAVADIARAAGMSQGNIYWYFASKDSILQAVLESAFTALEELFQRVASSPGTGRDRLLRVVEEYIALGRTGGGSDATVILYSFLRGGPGRLSSLGFDMQAIVGGYVTALSRILRDAQADGALPADAAPAALAMHFFAYFNGISLTLGDAAPSVPDDELRSAVLRLLGFNDQSIGGSE